MKQSIRQYAPETTPPGSAGPENEETRNDAEDGTDSKSKEDTSGQKGGLYQGGQVTTGTPYDGDYGKPEPNREATTKDEEN